MTSNNKSVAFHRIMSSKYLWFSALAMPAAPTEPISGAGLIALAGFAIDSQPSLTRGVCLNLI